MKFILHINPYAGELDQRCSIKTGTRYGDNDSSRTDRRKEVFRVNYWQVQAYQSQSRLGSLAGLGRGNVVTA